MAARQGETRGALLSFIEDYHDEHGYAPTYQEIADGLGLASKNTVSHHIIGLEEEGLLRRVAGQPRSLCVI